MGECFSVGIHAPKSDKQNGIKATVPELTDKEKAIVRSTWSILESRSSELATDIFLRIFERRPEVKVFFPFRSEVGESLVKHPHFKSHSMRFINAVRMTLTNMDAWEVIHIPNLRKLGEHHTRIPGFTHDIFEVFYYAMDDVWTVYLGRTYTGKTKSAWCKIFKFIIDQVENGYMDAADRNRNTETISVTLRGVELANADEENTRRHTTRQ